MTLEDYANDVGKTVEEIIAKGFELVEKNYDCGDGETIVDVYSAKWGCTLAVIDGIVIADMDE